MGVGGRAEGKEIEKDRDSTPEKSCIMVFKFDSILPSTLLFQHSYGDYGVLGKIGRSQE